jgi:small subunit ribosomal protein S2
VALVDTNADPSLVDYVIPANDDAPRSIKVIFEYLAAAVEEGKKAAGVKKDSKNDAAKDKKEVAAPVEAAADELAFEEAFVAEAGSAEDIEEDAKKRVPKKAPSLPRRKPAGKHKAE